MQHRNNQYLVKIFIQFFVLSLVSICFANNIVEKQDNTALTVANVNGWTPINNGLPKVSLNALYSYDEYVFIGTDCEGIYRIKKDGTTWLPFSSDELTNAKVRVFYVRDEAPEYLYVGTNKGVYRIQKSHLNLDDVKPSWEKIGKLGLKNKELVKPDLVGTFLDDVTSLTSYKIISLPAPLVAVFFKSKITRKTGVG